MVMGYPLRSLTRVAKRRATSRRSGLDVVEHHRGPADPTGIDGVEDHHRPEGHPPGADETDLRSLWLGHAVPRSLSLSDSTGTAQLCAGWAESPKRWGSARATRAGIRRWRIRPRSTVVGDMLGPLRPRPVALLMLEEGIGEPPRGGTGARGFHAGPGHRGRDPRRGTAGQPTSRRSSCPWSTSRRGTASGQATPRLADRTVPVR